jgi:hypothetical protein
MSSIGFVAKRFCVPGTRARVVALACIAAAACAPAGADAAQHLGPIPKTTDSRCAPLSLSPHVVKLGGLIRMTAGPATANCGGPPGTVKWSWDLNDQNLEPVRPCRSTAPHCTFKAKLPTGRYLDECIAGTSAQGGWTSCGDYYAVLGVGYVVLGGTVSSADPTARPVSGLTVTLSGKLRHATTKTDKNGDFSFAIKKGDYTVSMTAYGKHFTHKVLKRFDDRLVRFSLPSAGSRAVARSAWLAGAIVRESFGKRPAASQSRCAPAAISAHIVNIGDKIVAHAGPATALCGGPSSKVRWSWPNDDENEARVPGLEQTHPCAANTGRCEYRARTFTPRGLYSALCIDGASPDGGWSSCGEYAIRFGAYHMVVGNTEPVNGKPAELTLTGPGGRQTTRADSAGNWEFAVKNGTYTLSVPQGHHVVKNTFRSFARPGKSVGAFSTG